MKRRIISAVVLVLLIALAIVINVTAAETGKGIIAVSDKVTAPDPRWPMPEQQEQGLKALQELMENK